MFEHKLWVQLGEPSRMTLYCAADHLYALAADDITVQKLSYGEGLSLKGRKYASDLVRVGDYPTARFTRCGPLPAIMIPHSTHVNVERIESMKSVLKRQKQLAVQARPSRK
ncbi:MAG: hypothetical protein ABFD94_06110 [Armatimonadia bacterium]